MSAAWLAAGAALAVVSRAVNVVRKRRQLRLIPAVSGHVPVLGRVRTISDGKQGHSHDLWRVAGDAGDAEDVDFVKVTILHQTFVIAVSPEAVNCVLKRQKWVPKNKGSYRIFRSLGSKTGSIINADPDEHAYLRKAFNGFFSSENIDSTMSQLAAKVEDACVSIARQAQDAADGKVVLDTRVEMIEIIEGVVKTVFFETKLDLDTQAVLDSQMDLQGKMLFEPLKTVLVQNRLHPLYYLKYRKNWHALHDAWERLTREAFERPMEEHSNAFWACIRRAFPDATKDKSQWERALTNVSAMYFAGSETTANGTAFTLAALAIDRDSLSQLEQELRSAGLLLEDGNSQARLPTVQDLAELRFLDAVFHESLRMFTPAVNGSVRQIDKPIVTKRQGTLPKGTRIFVPPPAVHHSTRAWGEDAAMWRPGRWMEGRSVAANKLDANGQKRHIPFSEGPQNCIGAHLATLETKLAVAMFVSRFHLTAPPELRATSVEELQRNATSFITLHQEGGLKVRFQPRSTV